MAIMVIPITRSGSQQIWKRGSEEIHDKYLCKYMVEACFAFLKGLKCYARKRLS